MPPSSRTRRASSTTSTVTKTLAWLERHGTERNRLGMARYGIRAKKAYGVSMATMRPLVKKLRRDHALALALFRSGAHEARLLAAFIDEPSRVTPSQMDRWTGAFDNWAVCDSTCFHLFVRTPHAWTKVREWAESDREFVKRAAFALLAGLGVHDKRAADAVFLRALPLIAKASRDERPFVMKAVNWALRTIGKRNVVLNAAAASLAERLAASPHRSARWIGKDAVRELRSAAVLRRLAARAQRERLPSRTRASATSRMRA